MAKSDLFDLKIFDQFVARGYQRRVLMREAWFSVPVIGNPHTPPIRDVLIDPDSAPQILRNGILGRYAGATYWKQRGPDILDRVEAIHTDRLWEFNLRLILDIREYLGISTPICIAVPTIGGKSEGLVSVLRRYPPPVTYLSGPGAKVYMGDCKEFTEADIDVVFSPHKAITGDSILSVIFDYPDPMEIVLTEE